MSIRTSSTKTKGYSEMWHEGELRQKGWGVPLFCYLKNPLQRGMEDEKSLKHVRKAELTTLHLKVDGLNFM